MFKGYPLSRAAYYQRKKRAKFLGCDIMDVPDGRGMHSNHIKGSVHHKWKDKIVTQHGYVKIRAGKNHPLSDLN